MEAGSLDRGNDMNFMGMGAPELIVIGLIAFLLFGAKGMQDGVKTVGKAVRDLKGQGNEFKKIVQEAVDATDAEANSISAVPPDGAVARPTGARPVEPKSDAPSPATAVTVPETGSSPASSGLAGAATGSSPADGRPA